MSNKYASTSISGALLAIGLVLSIAQLYKSCSNAPPPMEIVAVVTEKPFYVEGNKNIIARYEFAADPFLCRFCIMQEALEAIRENQIAENAIRNIRVGDTLTLIISETDERTLQNPLNKVPVAGLTKQEQTIMTPEQVRVIDYRHTLQFSGIAATCIILGITGLIYTRTRKKITRPEYMDYEL